MNCLARNALAALIAVTALYVGAAQAQNFPSRDITFILPYNPGGGTDPIARQFTSQLEKLLGGSIHVESRPGGGGTIGAGLVMRSNPDGYTIGLADIGALVYQPLLNPSLPYKSVDDYQPIVKLSEQPIVLVVRADARWKNFEEFVEEARQNPGKIRIGVAGLRTAVAMVVQQFNKTAGTRITLVPFSGGGGEAALAVLGGRIEAMVNSGASNLGHIRAGNLRALAVFKKGPFELFPDATPVGDKYDATLGSAFYIIGPKGMPKPVLDRLASASLQVLNSEEFLDFTKKNAYVTYPMGPDETRADIVRYSGVFADLHKFTEQQQ